MAELSLEFIAAQLEPLLDDQAEMRDDMTHGAGRSHGERHDLKILLKEVRALRRDDERLGRRLSRLEGHVLPQS